jgi:hypothetical protein
MSRSSEEWEEGFSQTYQRSYWLNTITGERTWEDPLEVDRDRQDKLIKHVEPPEKILALHVHSDWEQAFSQSHQLPYWINKTSGERTWEHPRLLEEGSEPRPSSSICSQPENRRQSIKSPKIAIIVPYRDLHPDQNRAKQLAKFLPYMCAFMQDQQFSIYIVEQSRDGRKFNRGKLLNIGYVIARNEKCDSMIFHDVDLLPSPELKPYYTAVPADHQAVHIARVWDRYNKNKHYFGGVVAFSMKGFAAINGFPNNFWGWGGEDDELFKRSEEVGS